MTTRPPSGAVAIPPSTYEPEGDVVTQHMIDALVGRVQRWCYRRLDPLKRENFR